MDDFKDLLEDLSEQEKQEVYKILNEYNNNGESKSLSALYNEDYEEIPVDIDTFLEDDMYCGQTTDNGKLIYPYWREQLRELFKDPNKYQEVAITGCLSGDTIIPLLNGDKISIKELASRNKLDEYVYSFDVDTNKYVSGHLVDAFLTGVKDVYKITLDNGEFVVATPNHKFMLRNKNWKSIDSGLKVGDSLMPLYRDSVKCGNGYYESIKHPQKDGTFIEEPTHRMVMRCKIGNFKGVVHHKDFNKNNNDPRNLLKSDWNTHKMYHARIGGRQFAEHNRKYKNGELSDKMYEKIHQGSIYGSRKRWSNPEEHKKMSELTTYRMKNGLSKKMSDIRWSDPKEHEKVSKQWAELNRDPELNIKRQIMKAVKISNLVLNDGLELNEENYNAIKLKNNMRTGYPQYKSVLKYITEYELLKLALNYNHKIVSIEYLGKEEVYDLTVEKYHNFALESGIVAHNSIGTGKSTVACYGMAYLLYRTMCLRDPVRYYKLTGGSTIVFAFFNNTLDLVNAVGFKTVQDIVMKSPWFMERGKVSGTKYLEYLPDKPIRFRVGSTAQHALGTHILCLSGETLVETNNGTEKIENLVDKNIIVKSYDKENNKIVYSEECKVYQTGLVNEIYEIELDDGSVLKCTPDHKFMLKNGEYKKAKDLTENDELFEVI